MESVTLLLTGGDWLGKRVPSPPRLDDTGDILSFDYVHSKTHDPSAQKTLVLIREKPDTVHASCMSHIF